MEYQGDLMALEVTGSLALIVNGALPYTEQIKAKIEGCGFKVAVDGGLNHCHALSIQPSLIIGDFDSVDASLLNSEQYKKIPKICAERIKDKTDLQLALDAINMNRIEQAFLFGASGKRFDQTLSNIYTLFQFPEKLILLTEAETVYAVNQHKISSRLKDKQISLFLAEDKELNIISQDKLRERLKPDKKLCYSFDDHSIVQNLTILLEMVHLNGDFYIETSNELVYALSSSEKLIKFASEPGQVISLFPIGGSAFCQSSGLKWNVKRDKALNFQFFSLSNICIGKEFHLLLEKGNIVCILNKNLYDTALL